MAMPFDVNVQPLILKVMPGQGQDVQFTVTNRSGGPLTGRGDPVTTPKGLEAWIQPRDKTEVAFTDGQARTFKFGVKPPADAKPQKVQFQVDWVDVADPTNRVSRSQAVEVEVGEKKETTPTPNLLWLWILLGVLVLAGVGVGIFFIVRPKIEVPQLRGRTLANADSLLKVLELTPTVLDSMLPGLPVGLVASQDPDSGKKLGKNGKVQVVVVSDTAIVPAVTGKQANVADTLLKAAGLQAALLDTLTADPPGLVLRQDPAAGARGLRSKPVQLWRVTGNAAIPPGLVGLTEGEARNRIRAAGLVDSFIRTPQLTGAFGTVTASDPASGTLPRGGVVKVMLLVEGTRVPDVRNQTWDQARAQVEQRRLIARQGTSYTQDANAVGKVSALSPSQDALVEVNTEVSVAVNQLCSAAKFVICNRFHFNFPSKALEVFKKPN